MDYTDGRHEEFLNGHGRPGQSLGPLVQRFTAVEEVASTVSRVTVHYPAPVLRQGLVVVDTPGANVENPRHVEVAGWVLREQCDAAIVAVPASFPVADTLAEFLRIHFQDSLHRCVFLATKIDLISAGERPRLLETIASRLTSKLGIERPVVLPASATAALGVPLPDGTGPSTLGPAGEAYRALRAQFVETEETIARTLQEQRALILLERLSSLVSTVLDGLKAELEDVEQRYQADHAALEANRIRELAPYIKQSKARHAKSLALRLDPVAIRGRSIVANAREKAHKKIKKTLDEATDKAALQAASTQGVTELLDDQTDKIQSKLGKVLRDMGEIALNEIQSFEASFLQIYQSLATLGGRIALDGQTASRKLSEIPKELLVSDALDVIRKSDEKVDGIMKGFAWTGAAIGTAISPIIGTAIGFLAGAFLGAFFEPSIDELRNRCWQALRPDVEQRFERLESAVEERVATAEGAIRQQLNAVIDRYFEQYDALVRRMIAADQKKARELGRLRRKVRDDLASLEQRSEQLHLARTGLQRLHKL